MGSLCAAVDCNLDANRKNTDPTPRGTTQLLHDNAEPSKIANSITKPNFASTKMESTSILGPSSNLYREQTDTVWKAQHMLELEEEMKMEMEAIRSRSAQSGQSLNSPYSHSPYSEDGHIGAYDDYDNMIPTATNITPSSASMIVNHVPTNTMSALKSEDNNTNIIRTDIISTDYMDLPKLDDGRGSNLVQTESCDWDSDQLEEEEHHIKKQLQHLKSANDVDSNQ